jgi:sugar transferase (PEP-CTERM/EpsH1 system associated)
MRVLFLTHRLPFAPNRGDRIRAYHMLRHLSEHAEVYLLSLVHDSAETNESVALPPDRVTVVRTTPWRNKLRSALLLPTSRPLTHTLLDAPGLEPALAAMVRASKPDVVLAYCSGVARLALTGPLKGIPLVLDMVDVDSAKWQALSETSAPPLGWVYGREARCLGRFESEIVAHATTTLVVNERERRTLAEASPDADIRTVPNGIDLEHFQPTEPLRSSGPRVVFCGVMNYQPNEEAAIRLIQQIWPKVRQERPDARLVIVGAHPTTRLEQVARHDETVEVTGTVPDVRSYLWNAAVSIAPLTTARGIQNKVLEALAAELPVVVTPAVADGLPPGVMPGCIVAGDDGESAEAILSLLALSATERRAMAGRADLSELGWATQLAPLVPILTAAALRKSTARLAS